MRSHEEDAVHRGCSHHTQSGCRTAKARELEDRRDSSGCIRSRVMNECLTSDLFPRAAHSPLCYMTVPAVGSPVGK